MSAFTCQFFFFSGRRRHTRCLGDWSSDVVLFRSPLASGQRPSIIRLAGGRLFFVGDHNPPQGKHKPTDGAYVALSDHDGTTWTTKNLPPDVATVGYTTATRS